MHPNAGHGLPLGREPDHVHRRAVSRRPARSAFQRGLKFPHRRVVLPADVFKRNARLGFAATAFDLQPAAAAIEALRDRRRRLRGAAIPLNSD